MNALRGLAETARETVESGYYRRGAGEIRYAPSLVKAIEASKEEHGLALLAEINPAATLARRAYEGGQEGLMRASLERGACGLVVATEPHRLHGSLALLRTGIATKAPVLMYDLFLSEIQIDCAAAQGASAIVVQPAVLPRSRVQPLIEYAHVADREVVLECADRAELEAGLETEADVLALAARDLATLRLEAARVVTALDGFEADRPLLITGGLTAADVGAWRDDVDAVALDALSMVGKDGLGSLRRSGA